MQFRNVSPNTAPQRRRSLPKRLFPLWISLCNIIFIIASDSFQIRPDHPSLYHDSLYILPEYFPELSSTPGLQVSSAYSIVNHTLSTSIVYTILLLLSHTHTSAICGWTVIYFLRVFLTQIGCNYLNILFETWHIYLLNEFLCLKRCHSQGRTGC